MEEVGKGDRGDNENFKRTGRGRKERKEIRKDIRRLKEKMRGGRKEGLVTRRKIKNWKREWRDGRKRKV